MSSPFFLPPHPLPCPPPSTGEGRGGGATHDKREIEHGSAAFDRSIPPARCRPRGFSIVEVLVSAAILGIAVVAIVAMVRKGGDLQAEGNYRRKARTAITARFETLYNHENYPVIAAGENDSTITFGAGAGGDSLVGTLHTTIVSEALTVSATPNIPVQKVTIVLAWDTFDGERDSISMTKWISE